MEKTKPLKSLIPKVALIGSACISLARIQSLQRRWGGGSRKKRQFAEYLGASAIASDR